MPSHRRLHGATLAAFLRDIRHIEADDKHPDEFFVIDTHGAHVLRIPPCELYSSGLGEGHEDAGNA